MRRVLVAAVAALVPAVASAQGGGLFGSNGISSATSSNSSAFGGTGGASSFGGATGGSSAFGGSSLSGSAMGGSALGGTAGGFGAGAGGLGGATGGLGAMGASALGSQLNAFGSVGQTVGTSGFIGRAAPTTGQVGNRAAGQQNGAGNLGQALNRLGNNRGNNQGNANGNKSPPKLVARPVQRIAFDYDAPSPSVAQAAVSSRLAALSTRRPSLNGVTVSVDDQGRHVLSGVVPNESARGLAAAFARLEPGVREVVNDLTVDGVATP